MATQHKAFQRRGVQEPVERPNSEERRDRDQASSSQIYDQRQDAGAAKAGLQTLGRFDTKHKAKRHCNGQYAPSTQHIKARSEEGLAPKMDAQSSAQALLPEVETAGPCWILLSSSRELKAKLSNM